MRAASQAEAAAAAARRVSYLAQAGLDRAIEHGLGVKTGHEVSLADLGIDEPERNWHSPSDWVATWLAIRRLSPSASDVFLDVGSGLGRVLLVAARVPFARVIGVEIAENLIEGARANVQRAARAKRCGAFELVLSDVADYAVPADVTVVHMFNAVTGETFDRLLVNLQRSLAGRPRPLYLLYNFPVEHERVLAAGGRLIDVVSGHFPSLHARGYPIATYALGSAAEPPPLPRLSRPRRIRTWRPLRTGSPPGL